MKSSTTPARKRSATSRVMCGQAEGVGAGAGHPDRLGRAAGALGGGRRRVVPQAHGHAHHVVTGVAQQLGRHDAVHPAAHRHRHPVAALRQAHLAEAARVPGLEGARDRVLDDLHPVPAARAEPAQVARRGPRPISRRASSSGAPLQPRAGGARRGRGRAAAEGLEARLAHPARRRCAGRSAPGRRRRCCRTRRRRPRPPSPRLPPDSRGGASPRGGRAARGQATTGLSPSGPPIGGPPEGPADRMAQAGALTSGCGSRPPCRRRPRSTGGGSPRRPARSTCW